MKYLLDTAVTSEIIDRKDIIDGVTTNPKLIRNASTTNFDFVMSTEFLAPKYRFIQIKDMEDFQEIAPHLVHLSIDNLIFKITMDLDGINFINEHEIRLRSMFAATTVYDIVQLNTAINLKMGFSMVYVDKNDDSDFLEKAVALKKETNSDIKLVAASLHSKESVKRAIRSGVDFATIPPNVFDEIFYNLDVESEVNELWST